VAQQLPNTGPLVPGGEVLEDFEVLLDGVVPRSPVFAVAWSEDGNTIAAGAADGTIRLWDPSSGALRWRLNDLATPIISIAITADGRRLAAASDHGIVRLWNLEREGEPLRISGWSVAFSPDGRRLATGAHNGTLYYWDAESGERLDQINRLHRDRISALDWSADGKTLASASWDRTVRLINTEDGSLLHRLEGHELRVSGVAWSSDSRQVASGSFDGTVRVWDSQTGHEVQRFDRHVEAVLGVSWNPAAPLLASASKDTTVRAWDLLEPKEIFLFERHLGAVFAVTFSPDGHRLASGSEDGTVRIWTMASPQAEVRNLEGHANRVSAMGWGGDGKLLAIGDIDGTIRLWTIDYTHGIARSDGPRLIPSVDDRRLTAIAVSPRGDLLGAGFGDGTIDLWTFAAERGPPFERKPLIKAHAGSVTALAISPDGRILASGSSDESVKVWQWSEGRQPREFAQEAAVAAVAFGPDGQTLAAALEDRTVRAWIWSTGQWIGDAKTLQDVATHLAFSSQSHLTVALRNDTLYKWDRTSNEVWQVYRFLAHVSTVSSWDRHIATSSLDRNYVRLESQAADGTYQLRAMLIGGARDTWIDCQADGRCRRYDDGTLLLRRMAGGSLVSVPPASGTAPAQLVIAGNLPSRLDMADGDLVTLMVRIRNQGPGPAYWVNVRQKDAVHKMRGKDEVAHLVFYPPPTLVVLESGEEADLVCKVSAHAPYFAPGNRAPHLELEAMAAFAEPVPIPPVEVSISVPTLEWREASLSRDESTIAVTIANTGSRELSSSHFLAQVETPGGAMYPLAGADAIPPGEEITLWLGLPEEWRRPPKERFTVIVRKSQPPIHQWKFLDKKIRRPLFSSNFLYLLALMWSVLAVVSFLVWLRRPARVSFRKWIGAKSVNLVIVFTDIVESTDLANKLGVEPWSKARNKHLARASLLISSNRGHFVKTTGDGIMAAFRNVLDALNFALGLSHDTGNEKIRIRAGIHAGVIEVEENDAHGKNVHMAARIASMANAGTVWSSDVIREIVLELFGDADPYRWLEQPDKILKGFDGRFTLWVVDFKEVPEPE